MRPIHVKAALLLIPALLVALFTHADDRKAALPKDWSKATAYKVLRGIDGDTIEIEKDGKPVRVRLIGVDKPETVHPSKPVEAFGKEASKFTCNLLKGESVYLEYDKDKADKYGRTLAFVYRAPDGLFVNAGIIRQGYGRAYTKCPFDDAHEGGARGGAWAVGQYRRDRWEGHEGREARTEGGKGGRSTSRTAARSTTLTPAGSSPSRRSPARS